MVERGGLENRCGGNSTQGSNPCLSAKDLQLLLKHSQIPPHPPLERGASEDYSFKKNLPPPTKIFLLRHHLTEDR